MVLYIKVIGRFKDCYLFAEYMKMYIAAVLMALALTGLVLGASILVTADEPVEVDELVVVELPEEEPQYGCDLPIFHQDEPSVNR